MSNETKRAIREGIALGIILAASGLLGALFAIELMRMYP
jgi:hypothetical protein